MKSIHIKNYKNLKDFKIDSLSKINLIVGKNNVGKSTLLEAISIFASGGNILSLREILDIRGEIYDFPYSLEQDKKLERHISSFLSLISDRDIELFIDNGISIICDISNDETILKKEVEIKLVKYIETSDSNNIQNIKRQFLSNEDPMSGDPNIEYGILVKNKINNDFQDVLYKLGGRIRQLLPNIIQKTKPYELVRTNEISRNKNPELFDKISLTPLEKEIVTALKIIEPNIEDINFLTEESLSRFNRMEERVPFVVFPLSSKKLRLTSMGDGLNRILTIILALLNSKDGFLLIDEFENGLHYTVQTQLWKIIYQLSEKLNIQVFATTHSDDCIKSFIESDTENKGKLIRLEDIDGDIKSIAFNDKERLNFAIKNNIEVR